MTTIYTQLYIQFIFAVKSRNAFIPKQHKKQVEKHITNIIQQRKHKVIAINMMPDHIHIFVGLNPKQSIEDVVNHTKFISAKYIRQQSWMKAKFRWQDSYGAFSYSRSHIDSVVKYINNQEQHHTKQTFKAEYLNFLNKFEVEYDEEDLFEFYDF
ncbi:MAG: IS200/IS605 family transposase [Saprospiraceae bacterium]